MLECGMARKPAISDPYAYVIEQMARGVPLKTERRHNRTQAFLGTHEIPVEIVERLRAEKKIERTAQLSNLGAQHGKHRWWKLL